MSEIKKLLLIIILSGITYSSYAQNIGVGTTTPDPSAQLHISDTNRGLLIPNISLTDVSVPAPVTAPATGLLIWNTNASVTGGQGAGYYYWDGSNWTNLIGPAGPPGMDGADGVDGAPGAVGPTGPPGMDGADGVDGAPGAVGPTGPPGMDGADGVDGAPGAAGPTGPPGMDGADGVDGAPGAVGPAGPPGLDGADGMDGATGAVGPTGPQGESCWDLNSNGVLDTGEDINNDGVGSALDCSGSNTLDEAYDEGGPGAGRVITADAGAVEVNGEGGLIVNTTTTSLSTSLRVDNTNGTHSAGASFGYVGVNGSTMAARGVSAVARLTQATGQFDGGLGVYGAVAHPNTSGIGTINLNTITNGFNRAVGVAGGIASRTSFTGDQSDVIASVWGNTGAHNGGGGSVTGSRLYAGLFSGNGRTLGLWGENSTYMEFLPRWQSRDYRTGVIGFMNNDPNGGNNSGILGTADSYMSIETNVTDAQVKHLVLQTRSTGNVGIGTSTPHPSAKLQIQDANKGVLISQVSIPAVAGAAPVTNPATGLLVWNTNATTTGGIGAGFYFWDGTMWSPLLSGASSMSHNTLDKSYDEGGPGLGRQIDAVDGAVRINGEDGLIVTGNWAFGDDVEVTGAGVRMFFNPKRAATRMGRVTGTQWNQPSLGSYSLAGGYNAQATDDYAFSYGVNTEATESSSFAVGSNTRAYGAASSAMGTNSEASGSGASAIGANNVASGFGSAAIGMGAISSGSRAIAFSGGEASGEQGFAHGYNAVASGKSSAAFNWATASGEYSFASGTLNNAGGNYSVAMGYGNITSANYTAAFGRESVASGLYSFAAGNNAMAKNVDAVALGNQTEASGRTAFATGSYTDAVGLESSTFGRNTTAVGDRSTAFGAFTQAYSYGEFVIGANNTSYSPLSATSFNSADRLFVVGNGTNSASLSNALTVYKDGRLNINDAYTMPTADGGAGEVLTTDGAGNTSWTAGASLGTDNQNLTGATLSGNTLQIDIESGSSAMVDLSSLVTSSNTLDEAYDEGGAGAGRIITADAGAVEINGAGGLEVNTTTTGLSWGTRVENSNGTHSAIATLGYVGTSGSTMAARGVSASARMTQATGQFDGGFGVYGSIAHPNASGLGTIDLNTGLNSFNRATGIAGGIAQRTSFTGDMSDVIASVWGNTSAHNSSGGSVTGSRLYSGLFSGNGRTLGLWGENSTYMEFLPRWQSRDYRTGVIGFMNSDPNGGNNSGTQGAGDSYMSIETNVTDAQVKHLVLQTRSAGSVGVGTSAPTAKLSVNGTANKTGGGAWAVFSDASLKENVSPYREGLDLIKQINPVNFSYNDKMDRIWGEDEANKGRIYQGVIAQELQEVAPDMVREVTLEDKDSGASSETVLEVDPNKFTYALINAIKEQQAQMDEQQAQIDRLEKLVEQLQQNQRDNTQGSHK